MSFHPRTPQSPSQVSPATSSDALHNTQASSMTTATTLPTPAHSVTGCASQNDVAMTDDSPQKRKRAIDDEGGDCAKKVHLERRGLDIQALHLDVGPKYLLCQNSHTGSLPRTTEDLYSMFNLTGLAAEVAREKPNGEKNALRKTYKGHIKRLGVAGHFDVVKKPEDAPSDFMAMLQVPDLEWDVHQVKGKEIGDGLSETSLSSLGRAMSMAKGPIPRGMWDTSVLGDLAPLGSDTTKASGKPTTPGTPLAATPGATNRPKPNFPPGHDPTRSKRNIKKRSYGDSSYEGYGEGFPDDDVGAEGGYSTGEGEGGQKRRKKNSGNASPYPGSVRQQNYGPGMVGA